MNPWLGGDRGFLTDWITQRWVRLTGRRIALADAAWLRGPVAAPTGVAEDEFEHYAARERLTALAESDDHGLLEDFGALRSERFDPSRIRPEVVDFYEHTARYRLHLWSQWSPAFAPFGRAAGRGPVREGRVPRARRAPTTASG